MVLRSVYVYRIVYTTTEHSIKLLSTWGYSTCNFVMIYAGHDCDSLSREIKSVYKTKQTQTPGILTHQQTILKETEHTHCYWKSMS